MSWWSSLILGLTQGLAEFIPISSSGHLVVISRLLKIKEASILFDAFLHLGTLLAVLIFFRRQWWQVIKGAVFLIGSLWRRDWRERGSDSQRLFLWLILGTIPAALAGWLWEDQIAGFFSGLTTVGLFFIIVAIIFIIVEKIKMKKPTTNDLASLRWYQVLGIGLAQMAALFPGISRSGMTISAGMLQGLRRTASARFSFLLSAPIILGAGLVGFKKLLENGANGNSSAVLIIGFLAAAGSGYLAIKYLLRYLAKHSLLPFAYYLLVAGGLIIIFT